VCWHLYVDDIERHRGEIVRHRRIMDSLGGVRPEIMVTEWNKGFDKLSVEELAFEPRRAAHAGAILLAMMEAGVDRSFYYHFLDQVAYWEDFSPIFSKPEIMYHHWNEVPHRFGMFGVREEVRPQYFLYWMLLRLGERRVLAKSDCGNLRVIAGTGEGGCGVVVINFGVERSADRAVRVRFEGVGDGARELCVYRIDHGRRWNGKTLEMEAVERREVDVRGVFEGEFWCEGDSVTLVEIRMTNDEFAP
jgi:xylan 1,4-beta-xylosidase